MHERLTLTQSGWQAVEETSPKADSPRTGARPQINKQSHLSEVEPRFCACVLAFQSARTTDYIRQAPQDSLGASKPACFGTGICWQLILNEEGPCSWLADGSGCIFA